MKQRSVIGSVCVVMAVTWLASTPVAAQRGGGPNPEAAAAPTPRDAAGHPIIAGVWANGIQRGDTAANNDADGNNSRVLRGRPGGEFATQNSSVINFERDSGVRQRVYKKDTKPYYKPQFWERVKFNDVHGHNKLAPDPAFLCMPQGVPRIGLPREILQSDRALHFLYNLHQRTVYMDWSRSSPYRGLARHLVWPLRGPLGGRYVGHQHG